MKYFGRGSAARQRGWAAHYGKALTLLLALWGALAVTLLRGGPLATLLAGPRGARAAAARPAGVPYDLTALRILNMTLVRIKDNYVDPTRIDPKRMLLKALNSVQRDVAEVLVEAKPERDEVTVRVDVAERTYSIAGVDSPWALSAKLREIFRFIQRNLHSTSDTREIEYSAINGMLRTLDPHSLLLDPEAYAEMRIQTKGSFGGLGMVLSIRRRQLTIISPMKGTPAGNAGFKAGDHIARINNESTANMTLTEAVNRLRGEPGTKVTVWIEREGWKTARKFVLTRAIIQVESVESRVLTSPHGKVGYIKLKAFQGNSARDLRQALADLRRKRVRGVVLDLRHNPGGLLDQAIKVADLFVDHGTLVTTVGYAGRQREEKRATGRAAETRLPMAVLVNSRSASASEIVAGALKNLDRAVVIGAPTFGKGSVQVLYDNEDSSALKLTIAQYLTPGDVSIQLVGITPDVRTVPVRVPARLKTWCDAIFLHRDSHDTRESDLQEHLTSQAVRREETPRETIRYFDPPKPRKPKLQQACESGSEDVDLDDDFLYDDDKFEEDFDIRLARDLVAQARSNRRSEILARGGDLFVARRAEETERVTKALRRLGIDWTLPPAASGKPELAVTLTRDRAGQEVKAGDLIRLRGTVTNRGTGEARRVFGTLKSDSSLFKDRELVFGRVAPGESRTFTLQLLVPRATRTRLDPVRLVVKGEGGVTAPPAELRVKMVGQPRPLFAYGYQVLDTPGGNGNGLIEPGESIRMRVTVKNNGEGRSYKSEATLKNDSGDGVFLRKGRFALDSLQPGESRQLEFTFDVRPNFQAAHVQITLGVIDLVLRENVEDKLKFQVPRKPPSERSAGGTVKVRAGGAQVRGGASPQARVIGYAKPGAAFSQTARFGNFARVALSSGQPGFILTSKLEEGPPTLGGPVAGYAPVLQVSPPRIRLRPGALATTDAVYHLEGEATDEHRVADVYVFVTNRSAKVTWRKVAYRSNRNGVDKKRMRFKAAIPLMPGVNRLTVFARQDDHVRARQTLIITRLPAAAKASKVQ